MMDIPENDNDNRKSRMDKFVEYVVNELKRSDSAVIWDDWRCNDKDVPGITYPEARSLAEMFAEKGYHARAYYIDVPSHGFRSVEISKHVQRAHTANCAHSEVWA